MEDYGIILIAYFIGSVVFVLVGVLIMLAAILMVKENKNTNKR